MKIQNLLSVLSEKFIFLDLFENKQMNFIVFFECFFFFYYTSRRINPKNKNQLDKSINNPVKHIKHIYVCIYIYTTDIDRGVSALSVAAVFRFFI